MRSANPVLNDHTFAGVHSHSQDESMTINGTVLKTGAFVCWSGGTFLGRGFRFGRTAVCRIGDCVQRRLPDLWDAF